MSASRVITVSDRVSSDEYFIIVGSSSLQVKM